MLLCCEIGQFSLSFTNIFPVVILACQYSRVVISAVNETIDKCNRMLRETTNEEAGDIKNKLDTIRNQVNCAMRSNLVKTRNSNKVN